MSMFDDVLGLGRTAIVDEAVEPELEDSTIDSAMDLGDGVDPMEFMIEAMYENELNMKNLDAAIMCEEYNYFRENGSEMVYEAGTFSNIIEKAKKAVLNMWNKIQAFIKKQIRKFTDSRDKAFLDKYQKRALQGKTGTIQGYNITEKSITAQDSLFEDLADLAKTLTDAAVNATKKGDYKDREYVEKKLTKKNSEGYYYIKLGEKKTVQYDASTAIKTFKNMEKSKEQFQKLYDKSKKVVDDQLKILKQCENAAKKFKIIPTDTSSKLHSVVKGVNLISTRLAIGNREMVKILNIQKAQCKAAIIAAAAKSVKKESAGFDDDDDGVSSSFIEGVEVL